MTYYLRDIDNRTVVDLDFTHDDFHVVVLVRPMVELMHELDIPEAFLVDMERLQELRGEWWEKVVPSVPKKEQYDQVRKWAKFVMQDIAARWPLTFVVD